jgi:hypothetical protein
MDTISFVRKSERILTWVEPREGFTLEQVVAALNAGEAEIDGDGVHDVGVIVRKSDRFMIAEFQECQTTAGPDVDEGFAVQPH